MAVCLACVMGRPGEREVYMMRSAGGWIYAARKADSTLIKIGCTKRTVGQRLQGLTRHYHAAIVLCGAVRVDQGAVRVDQAVHHIERRVHVLLTADCVEGEWFATTITQERLNQATQHWHTGSTCKRAIAVFP
jgi:hypothetical protein